MRRPASKPTSTTSGAEAGTGLVGALAGVAAFLGFLLLAAQVLLHLYATSVATSAAFDAARIVSGSGGGPVVEQTAEAHARRLLGPAADGMSFDWSYTDIDGDGRADVVALRVHGGRRPSLVPLAPVDRTVTVRMERRR